MTGIGVSAATVRNIGWRTLQIACKQGVSFFIFLISARLLSQFDFGLYTYAMAVVSLLVLIGDFGISSATSRFIAEHSARGEERSSEILFNAGIILLIVCAAAAIAAAIVKGLFFEKISSLFIFVIPLIFLIPLSSLYDGIYRGMRRFKQLAIVSVVTSVVCVPVVLLVTRAGGLQGALLSQSIFYGVYIVVLAIGYRAEGTFSYNPKVLKQISLYSFYIGFSSLGYYLFSRIDVLILGHAGYIDQIAVYELLNKLFALCLIPLQIIAQVLAPEFATLGVRGEHRKIIAEFRKYALISFLVSVLFVIVSLIATPLLIHAAFTQYDPVLVSAILVPTILIYATSVYTSILHTGILVSIGYANVASILNVALAVGNFFLAIILLQAFGYIGVIYATLGINILGTIALESFVYWRRLKPLAYAAS